MEKLDLDGKMLHVKIITEESHVTPTGLHLAFNNGNYDLITYFVTKNLDQLANMKSLPQFIICNSLYDRESVLITKVRILELLKKQIGKRNKDWMNDYIYQGQSDSAPQCTMHKRLWNWFLDNGADVNTCDAQGNTILHLFTKNFSPMQESQEILTPEAYHKFCKTLDEKGFTQWSKTDRDEVTPMHVAVVHVELLEETFKLFRRKGVDCNATNTAGESILFKALAKGRSPKFIELLGTYGSKLNAFNQYNQTVFHLCVQSNQLNALQFVLDKMVIGMHISCSHKPQFYLEIN